MDGAHAPAPERTDPGLSGVVPFRFACHRCGHCCSAGDGYVWLAEGEVERLAEGRGMTEEAFRHRCVRSVPHPETGELREALVEHEGRCVFLEGRNHCTVYTDRPEHCRTFPYWRSVLAEPAAFERARAVCPGIAVEPPAETRREAFRRLEAIYAEVDEFVDDANPVCIQRGVCCRFEEAGHELFTTGLEADYALDRHPNPPAPEAPGRCPYHVRGRCTAREGRPLACRTYFCDAGYRSVLAEATEHHLRRIREIETDTDYPVAYGRFPALLAARSPTKPGRTEPGRTEPGPPRKETAGGTSD